MLIIGTRGRRVVCYGFCGLCVVGDTVSLSLLRVSEKACSHLITRATSGIGSGVSWCHTPHPAMALCSTSNWSSLANVLRNTVMSFGVGGVFICVWLLGYM